MSTDAGALGCGLEPVPVTSAGGVPDAGWQGLPGATLRAWHVDNVLGLIGVTLVLGSLALLGHPLVVQPWLLPLAGLAVLAAVLESAVVLPRLHRSYRYTLSTGSVVVESGGLVRRQLVVPLHQVLYVETHQGPVLRGYGLTRVRLGTIADPRSVGPLTRDAAQALCRAVEASRASSEARERPQ